MNLEKIEAMLKNRDPEVFGFAELNSYAVLIPLVEQEGRLQILFEVRARQLRRQPGEICFPGGKRDADDPHEEWTAVRETSEELGIDPNRIRVMGKLGVLVPPYQIAVHAYAGKIEEPSEIKPSVCEVEEVFFVPLDFFLEHEPEKHLLQLDFLPEEGFPYEHIPGGKNYRFRKREIPEYFYFWEGRVIWGLTARIVLQFVRRLKGLRT